MAPPGSQILTVPRWFLPPSGSQIINCNYHFCNNSLFCFLHQLLSEQPWNSLSFVQVFSNGIQQISAGSKYKSNYHKNGKYNKSFGCQDHRGIARSILRLSSSKNEGGGVHLCQNSAAFMLPTTVAPAEHALATTVVLGSFSAALILLSLNDSIFSSDFASERFFARVTVSQVKVTCFQH